MKIAARERHNLEIRMAIKIQAWWRMIMVMRMALAWRRGWYKRPRSNIRQVVSIRNLTFT